MAGGPCHRPTVRKEAVGRGQHAERPLELAAQLIQRHDQILLCLAKASRSRQDFCCDIGIGNDPIQRRDQRLSRRLADVVIILEDALVPPHTIGVCEVRPRCRERLEEARRDQGAINEYAIEREFHRRIAIHQCDIGVVQRPVAGRLVGISSKAAVQLKSLRQLDLPTIHADDLQGIARAVAGNRALLRQRPCALHLAGRKQCVDRRSQLACPKGKYANGH